MMKLKIEGKNLRPFKRIGIAVILVGLLLVASIKILEIYSLSQWKQEMLTPGIIGKTVIIDPGHGGADPGAVVDGFKEADINMGIALALKKELELNGVKVKLTRDGDVGLVPEKRMSYSERWFILEQRRQFAADQKGHLLISVHSNSNKDPRAAGPIVYYSDESSRTLALSIQNQLNAIGNRKRQAECRSFNIIYGNTMPSVLVETGFISNKSDREILLFKKDFVGKAIFRGIDSFAASLGHSD